MSENPKLVILSKSLRGQSFVMNKEQLMVGRTDSNDIYLPDGTISTEHAKLIKDEDGAFIVHDLGSTNGTRINGTKISEKKLVSGDVVQFGSVELLFDSGDENSGEHITKTRIDITQTGTMELPDLSNYSPFGPGADTGKSKKVYHGVIALLIIAIVLLGVNIILAFL